MKKDSFPRDNSLGFPVTARKAVLILAASIVAFALEPTQAGNVTWDGGGANNNWNTALNWGSDIAPVANDALFFDGAVRLTPSNNLTANTSFAGITFNSGASAFTLSGNAITLGGDITNNSTALQSIGLAMIMGSTRTVNAASGDIAISGVLSGAGGLTKTGAGTLTFSGINTYTGTTTVSAGSLALSGGAAIVDTGAVNLDTSGANLTLNASEAIGSLTGVAGTTVALGTNTLTTGNAGNTTFAGVIGGAGGGLTKQGAGTFTLSGANTYTGATTTHSGILLLDFSQAGAPTTNIVSTSSNLVLEGGALSLKGASTATNSQAFNGTTLSSGASTITLTQNDATSLTASLGTISRTAGATLNFSVAPSTSGVIATTTNTNTNGLLGAWASTGTGATLNYATVNGSNQIVAYTGATDATEADLSNVTSATENYKYSAAATLAGNQTGNTLQYTGGASTTALGANSLTLNGLMNAGTGTLTITGTAENPGLVIGASGELDILSNSAAIIISSVVSGTGDVVYSGGGTLTLSGNNTYTGTTTINSGTLTLSGGSAIADSGQVNIAGTTGTPNLTLSTSETIGSLTGVAGTTVTLGSNTLTTGDAGNTTFAGVISGAGGGLTKQGAGTFTLSGTNTYTGTTTVSAGSLALSGSKAIADTGAVNLDTAGANLTLNASESIGTLNGVAGSTVTLGVNQLGINSGGTYAGNIDGGSNSQVTLVGGTLTLSGTNDLYKININGGALILSGGSALGDTTAVSMGTSGTLTLNSSETIGNLGTTGTGNTLILNNNTLTVNTASGATFAGVISGSGGLTVAGGSTLTLAGANTYTGTTTARSGTLMLNFSTAGAPTTDIISTSSSLALEGGTLGLTGKSTTTNSQSFNGTTVSSGNSIITLTHNGATSLTASLGEITRTAGATLNFSVEPTSVVIATTDSTNTNGILGPWASTGTAGSMKYATVNGSNQIVAYTGATGATAANLGNMTDATENYKYSAATTLSGNQTGNTLQYITGAGTTTALGTNSLTLNGLMNAGTGTLTISGSAGSSGLVIGASGELVILGNAQSITISSVVSGTGDVTYSGLGTLTLSGINTYTGTTTINSGIIVLNNGQAIANTGQVNIAGTTGTRQLTLASNTGSETIGSLKGVAGATVVLGTNTTLTTGDAGDTTFAGVISSVGGLTKQGTGTFTLSGANTYTGATTVTAGTLLINGSLASNATVTGGVFGGTGTANGAAISAGAALQGGDGASAWGALSLAGDVTLADNALIKLTLGGSGAHSSLTRTGGTWAFDSDQAFSFIDAGATVGVYSNLITGLTGTEAGLDTIATWTISNADWVGTFSLNGSSIDLNLTAVPEPATLGLLAFSLTTVLIFLRRRQD